MIVQGYADSFKLELWQAIHDFTADTFKLALYTSDASLTNTVTAYTATDEVVGTGYTAGGEAIGTPTLSLTNGAAIVDFPDVSWSSSTITARGGLIYNSSKANRAVYILNFGSDRSSSSEIFKVSFPNATSAEAILRIKT